MQQQVGSALTLRLEVSAQRVPAQNVDQHTKQEEEMTRLDDKASSHGWIRTNYFDRPCDTYSCTNKREWWNGRAMCTPCLSDLLGVARSFVE